ncbi:hypothetical protein [Protaetiibacter intestinalis]|uniref:hypothetical protein n=1 Tax=Protaetiibacter intestinalis TaxID=2419774 RepID=UPI0013005C5B|nr:hypothetical protein [Protaetiibacter intestinalis]
MTDPTATPATPEEPTPAAAPAEPVVPAAEPVVPAAPAAAEPVVPTAPAAPVAEPVVPVVPAAPAAPVAEPVAPVAPAAPAAPAAAPAANPYAAPAAAPTYAAPGTPVKQTLSIVSFVLGIAGVVFSFIYGLGLIPGIIAVVLGFRAKKSEPAAPKWMSLTGIITGFVAIGISLIAGLITIVAIVSYFALINQYGSYYSN